MSRILDYYRRPDQRHAIVAATIFCSAGIAFAMLVHVLSRDQRIAAPPQALQRLRDFDAYYDGVKIAKRDLSANPSRYKASLMEAITLARKTEILPQPVWPSDGELDLAVMIEKTGPANDAEREFMEYLQQRYPRFNIANEVRLRERRPTGR